MDSKLECRLDARDADSISQNTLAPFVAAVDEKSTPTVNAAWKALVADPHFSVFLWTLKREMENSVANLCVSDARKDFQIGRISALREIIETAEAARLKLLEPKKNTAKNTTKGY